MNAGIKNSIGSLLVLFIPMSGHSKNVMVAIATSATKFLKLFIFELKHIFCYGFELKHFNYPAWHMSKQIKILNNHIDYYVSDR
jgi:hypothetical protein